MLLATDDRLAKKVGVLTMLVSAALIAFAVFVVPSIRDRGARRIRVYFHHTGGLHEGAPIVVAGRDVGVVESIASAPRDGSTPLGQADGVEVIVALSRDAAEIIPHGGDIFVASRGPLGDKYLEMGPSPISATGQLYAEKEQVLGNDPPQMDRVLNRTWDNLQITREFVEALKPSWLAFATQLSALKVNVDLTIPDGLRGGKLGEEIDALVTEVHKFFDGTLGGEDGIAHLGAVIDKARAFVGESRLRITALQTETHNLMASIDAVRGRVDVKGAAALVAIDRAIDKAKAALDKIDPLLANVAAIQDRLARGEGSLGRLMKDPEFPEDAKELGKILKRQPWKVIGHPPP